MLSCMTRVRAAALMLTLTVGSMVLSGCTPPTPTPTIAEVSTPTPTVTPSEAAPAPPPVADPAPMPPHTTDDPCVRDDVAFSFEPTDGTAGHLHGNLLMFNIGTRTCNVEGYPTLWFQKVGPDTPMGLKASKEPIDGLVASFDLVPGASAVAAVTITQAEIVEGCTVVNAVSFLAIPPLPGLVNDWENFARHVTTPSMSACDNPDIGLLSVGPMFPG
jgi:Protein of unknown function (DUF4232)